MLKIMIAYQQLMINDIVSDKSFHFVTVICSVNFEENNNFQRILYILRNILSIEKNPASKI